MRMVRIVLLGIMLCINTTWTARQFSAIKYATEGSVGGTVAAGVTLSDGSPIVMLLCVFITFIYFTPFRELPALLWSLAVMLDVIKPSPAGTKQEQMLAAEQTIVVAFAVLAVGLDHSVEFCITLQIQRMIFFMNKELIRNSNLVENSGWTEISFLAYMKAENHFGSSISIQLSFTCSPPGERFQYLQSD